MYVSLSLSIYIYIYMCIYVYIYIYMYIYPKGAQEVAALRAQGPSDGFARAQPAKFGK